LETPVAAHFGRAFLPLAFGLRVQHLLAHAKLTLYSPAPPTELEAMKVEDELRR
jgi:hypothetical protein